MIINFYAENFGSIKDRQLLSFEADDSQHLEDYYVVNVDENLRLLKIALIYGSNASGKTMLLKALSFLRTIAVSPLSRKDEQLDFEPFLFDENTINKNTILGIEFIHKNVRYDYEVEFSKLAVIREELYHYNPSKVIVYTRTTDIKEQLTQIVFSENFTADEATKKALQSNTLWNNTVLGGSLKTNMKFNELTRVCSWFASYLTSFISPDEGLEEDILEEMELKIGNTKERILKMLKKADFNINDILYRKQGNKYLDIKFEHLINGEKYLLPYQAESRGTQRFYSLCLLLDWLTSESTGVIVDELESSLHPELFEYFLITFLLNSNQSQLIATTHNREILRNKDLFRNDAIWITDRKEDCSTELYSLFDFDTSVIQKDTDIFEIYKSGKLGGIPNLGDNYLD